MQRPPEIIERFRCNGMTDLLPTKLTFNGKLTFNEPLRTQLISNYCKTGTTTTTITSSREKKISFNNKRGIDYYSLFCDLFNYIFTPPI